MQCNRVHLVPGGLRVKTNSQTQENDHMTPALLTVVAVQRPLSPQIPALSGHLGPRFPAIFRNKESTQRVMLRAVIGHLEVR